MLVLLTNFEYETKHAMTGNGNQVNLLKLAWEKFVKSHRVILCLAGFWLFGTTGASAATQRSEGVARRGVYGVAQ